MADVQPDWTVCFSKYNLFLFWESSWGVPPWGPQNTQHCCHMIQHWTIFWIILPITLHVSLILLLLLSLFPLAAISDNTQFFSHKLPCPTVLTPTPICYAPCALSSLPVTLLSLLSLRHLWQSWQNIFDLIGCKFRNINLKSSWCNAPNCPL